MENQEEYNKCTHMDLSESVAYQQINHCDAKMYLSFGK